MTQPDQYYGFYSKKADESHGHAVYLTPNGDQVKVTFATKDPLVGYYKYLFEDKEFVGPITIVVVPNKKARCTKYKRTKEYNNNSWFDKN